MYTIVSFCYVNVNTKLLICSICCNRFSSGKTSWCLGWVSYSPFSLSSSSSRHCSWKMRHFVQWIQLIWSNDLDSLTCMISAKQMRPNAPNFELLACYDWHELSQFCNFNSTLTALYRSNNYFCTSH